MMNEHRTANVAACLALVLSQGGCQLGCSANASVGAAEGAGGEVLRAGLESPFVLLGGDGEAALSILLRAPDQKAQRLPVALALVVDTSGSMAGHKIEHARSAVRSIVEGLADGDEVSLVSFDSSARALVPLTRVNATTRAQLRAAADQLADTGATALHAGMATGLATLDGAHNPSRRLLLISDGQANVGPATAEAIVAALPRTTAPVTISAIGVGTDYDEAVLASLGRQGHGGFHHLGDPVELAAILDQELRHARAVTATEAVIEIRGRPGVLVEGAAGLALTRGSDGTVRIAVGDLYAGEKRSLSLRVKLPLVDGAGGERDLGEVQLHYRPAGAASSLVQRTAVRYQVTASAEQVTRAVEPELAVAADRMRVANVLGDAAALLKEGDLLEAQALLRDERARLEKRRERLTGALRVESEALIAVLRDPYIDADLTPSAAAARAAVPASGPAPLPPLVEKARQGQPLPESELAGLDGAQLRILRNVPYARHGYPFNAVDLQRHFTTLGWYRTDAGFDNRRLTAVDAANVKLVSSYEGRARLVTLARPARGATATVDGARTLEALVKRAVAGEPLRAADLESLDVGQLRILRNACYARHGHPFRAADLQAWFDRAPWYHRDATSDDNRLTAQDRTTVHQVRERERSLVFSAAGDTVRDFQLKSQSTAHQLQ